MTFSYKEQSWELLEPDFYDAASENHIQDDQLFVPVGRGLVMRPPNRGLIERIDLPDGTIVHYEYDSISDRARAFGLQERLRSVRRTDVNGNTIQSEQYLYENEDLPFSMTGVIDLSLIHI